MKMSTRKTCQIIFILLFIIFYVCESAFEDQSKCGLDDKACLLTKFNSLLHTAADDGIPECNVPDIDPGEFHDLNVSYPSDSIPVLKASLTDGTFNGLRQCNYTDLNFDMTTGEGFLLAKCNKLRIETMYEFETIALPLDPILGGPIGHGKGRAEAEFDNIEFKFTLDVYAVKGTNNQIYLIFDKPSYTYTLENMTLHVSQVKSGDRDITNRANRFINENWRILNRIFGRKWYDIFVNYHRYWSNKLHRCIPANEYINGDLTKFVRNEQ